MQLRERQSREICSRDRRRVEIGSDVPTHTPEGVSRPKRYKRECEHRAWAGGRGERGRTLEIMKDPYLGPVGVAAVVCLLLLKFGALSALLSIPGGRFWDEMQLACAYILPPTLARDAVPLLFAQTPYVRVRGIGAHLAQYQSRAGAWTIAAAIRLGAIIVGRWYGLLATAVTGVTYLMMRRAFIRRLGGMTGDCAGLWSKSSTLTAVALALTASA